MTYLSLPWGAARRRRIGPVVSSGRVLVVDDEPAVGRVVADLLGDEGYEVRWSTNGREALDVLDEWLPDVIVLDLTDAGDGRSVLPRGAEPLPALPRACRWWCFGHARRAAMAKELAAEAAIAKPSTWTTCSPPSGRAIDRG